jgi:Bacterial SH3 domain
MLCIMNAAIYFVVHRRCSMKGHGMSKSAVIVLCIVWAAIGSPTFAQLGYESFPSRGVFRDMPNGVRFGIANDDKVNVRSSANLSGSIVQQLNAEQVVTIYGERGTDTVKNDIWDRWYKIAENPDEWINALFVNEFPLYLESTGPGHYFRTPPKSETDTGQIEYAGDRGSGLICDISRQKYAYAGKADYWFYISTPSPAVSTVYEDTWLHGSEIENLLGAGQRKLSATKRVFRSGFVPDYNSAESSKKTESPRFTTVEFSYKGFSVLCIQSGKEYYILSVNVFETLLNNPLKYGLNIGIKDSYVLQCLGRPDDSRDTKWTYRDPETDNKLILKLTNGLVSGIEWQQPVP